MVTQDALRFTDESPMSGVDSLVVTGGRRLAGEVRVGGFKHSLVTVLAATCAARAPAVITNCPAVAETDALAGLINDLGGKARYVAGTLTVDADGMTGGPVEDRGIHGSVYLAPALLTRSGEAAVPTGGGCQIGDSPAGRRPVDQYIAVLSRFGATVTRTDDQLLVRAARLTGCEIDLLDHTVDRERRTGPLYSGASKMAILAAAVAHGTSVLHNPYPKPDVTDLVTVLRDFGADIETTTAGTLVVHGRGPEALDRQVRHDLVADLIEVVTWICAGALLAGTPLRVHGANLARAITALRPELAVFTDLGIRLDPHGDELTVYPAESLSRTDVVVTSPGVFSDSHPLLALLMTATTGRSTITETVWSTRFGYQAGLEALGARLTRRGATITIDGPCRPAVPGNRIHAPDLRAAAALVLAALHVEGPTLITGTHHLHRGYPDFAGSLRGLGAIVEKGSAIS